MDDPASVELMLASQSITRQPCVVHFFAQDCPGCKAMHPKLNQIIRNNSDFKFIKVRIRSIARVRALCRLLLPTCMRCQQYFIWPPPHSVVRDLASVLLHAATHQCERRRG